MRGEQAAIRDNSNRSRFKGALSRGKINSEGVYNGKVYRSQQAIALAVVLMLRLRLSLSRR